MLTTFSVLLICSSIVCIYYWLDFFITGGVHVVKEEWYVKFQKSFLVADLWMSACAIVGAIGLLAEKTYGILFALIAGGSLIFLGFHETFERVVRIYRCHG